MAASPILTAHDAPAIFGGFHHIASPWQGLLAAVATGILQAVDQVRQAVPVFFKCFFLG